MSEIVCCEYDKVRPASPMCNQCWKESQEEEFELGKFEGFQEAADMVWGEIADNRFHQAAKEAEKLYNLGNSWENSWKAVL